MNKPEAHELLYLKEGEKKYFKECVNVNLLWNRVQYTKDTKIANAGSFKIRLEDHTLGNILRMYLFVVEYGWTLVRQLLNDPQVLFAGYKVPHPLENYIVVKIQTTHNSDPYDALIRAIRALKSEIRTIESKFQVHITHNQVHHVSVRACVCVCVCVCGWDHIKMWVHISLHISYLN